jgi:uncharacterized protein (DUF1697 family)
MMKRFVGLLRGINVGGNNQMGMKDLAAFFSAAGCKNVETYIQSGNVVFDGNAKAGAEVCARIEAQFGFKTTIILRSQGEMEAVAAGNPYPVTDTSHVVFLEAQPTAAQIAQLDPDRSAPDQFTVAGREIYLHLPNGAGRTKLTNTYFDSKLKTVSTIRNWRTVVKLLAMMTG